MRRFGRGRGGKFNNSWTEVDGIKFQSKREAHRYSQLKMLLDMGEISNLEMQVVYEFRVNDKLIFKYLLDFRYREKDGVEICEDVKGMITDVYKIKKKCIESLYGIAIIEV